MINVWWLMPLLAGMLLAVATGPLGSFVVWRRMAFFGDTLAHGALLGITFGVMADIDLTLTLVIGCLTMGLLLLPLQDSNRLSSDTLLGIISHSTLALGLVALSLTEGIRVDLMGYLFGDLLAITRQHVVLLALSAVAILGLLIKYWSGLIAVTVSPELAGVEGRPVARLNILLVIMLAITVALAMKVVGILLISALLIIPAATARAFARTPAMMAMLASAFGVIAVVMGMSASLWWDTPAGPSVVVSAMLLFIASLLKQVR
ncbi:MAG: metal ABC transporter permease [Oleibacter sp.]|nr:metal ABC transporter permease [Thalassolituus sp.]